jgi:hypothetical protein
MPPPQKVASINMRYLFARRFGRFALLHGVMADRLRWGLFSRQGPNFSHVVQHPAKLGSIALRGVKQVRNLPLNLLS